MKNIIYRALLPVTLFVTAVTSQRSQACINAGRDLLNNQPCYNAVVRLDNFFDDITGTTVVTRDVLNAYCTSTCRNLNLQVLATCANQSEVIIQYFMSVAIVI